MVVNLLFICAGGINRSRTAAELFEFSPYLVKYCAIDKTTLELLKWANRIIVMEDWMESKLINDYPDLNFYNKITTWTIPDIYTYQPIPDLIKIIFSKFTRIGI